MRVVKEVLPKVCKFVFFSVLFLLVLVFADYSFPKVSLWAIRNYSSWWILVRMLLLAMLSFVSALAFIFLVKTGQPGVGFASTIWLYFVNNFPASNNFSLAFLLGYAVLGLILEIAADKDEKSGNDKAEIGFFAFALLRVWVCFVVTESSDGLFRSHHFWDFVNQWLTIIAGMAMMLIGAVLARKTWDYGQKQPKEKDSE